MKTLIILIIMSTTLVYSQTGAISGNISLDGYPFGYINVQIKGLSLGGATDKNGYYSISNIPFGKHTLIASHLGYKKVEKGVILNSITPTVILNFELIPSNINLNQIVVTGTKTFKRQTESPVIVNVIGSRTLNNVQACNLSEGLKFQPGLRVETNCQTCNYTQLRMNGLGGGYSQILINGRPIFSPLTGLYGMEQIPVNMIDRIETVRGGGSALYGSSAIGGTVNVITKIPTENAYSISFTKESIGGTVNDKILSGNGTILLSEENAGGTFFINSRDREMYDHNGDNFSELPELKNNSFGANFFFLPTENQKLELSLSSLNEYRYGGEITNKPPHLALQSEERTHNILLGSLDYQINFNNDNSSFITYFAGQHTDRDHYTGIFPDNKLEIEQHLINPPYGVSTNFTLQGGTQFNHRLNNFLGGRNVFIVGAEYVVDDVFDEIEAYNYKIDQVSKNLGMFVQSDWEITPTVNLLSGFRADKHNLVDKVIISPRFSLLYKLKTFTQFRFTWSTGFRAPQAFDADLHIAFAGGGVSRISLSPYLKEERSNSISGSVNHDFATEHYIVGFTVEGFYTHLQDAFYQHNIGEDSFGELFEKRNGDGATVKGTTIELRGNYDQILQLEMGVTLQKSEFDNAVENIEGLPAIKEFLRTPKEYGYATFSYTPSKQFNASINVVYTGKMKIAHLAGAPEQDIDEYVTSPLFTELGVKFGYTIPITNLQTGIELFGGVKNLLNAYQNDFDSGKNRDSNFIYGPAFPRTIFLGLRVKSL